MKVRKYCLPDAYRLGAYRASCVGHLAHSLLSIVSISVTLICILNSPSCASPRTADGDFSLARKIPSDTAMLSSDTYEGCPQPNSVLPAPRAQTSPLFTIESFESKSNEPSHDSESSCTKCLPTDLIVGLIMAAIGAFLAVWYEGLGHPRLKLKIGAYSDRDRGRPHGRVRFLHIEVWNMPYKVPFVSQKTAYACEAIIDFRGPGRSQVGLMQGRWVGNPEPLKYEVVGTEIRLLPDNALLSSNRLINIPPNEFMMLDVAMRHATEPQAYGWTDRSYLHNWRHPYYLLDKKSYDVTVRVTTGDRSVVGKFRLHNPKSIDNFRLEAL